MLSCFSHVWLCVTLWTIAYQVPLSMGFFRQEYWSRVAMPSSRESSWPRDRTRFCLLHWQVGSLLLAPLGKPSTVILTGTAPTNTAPRFTGTCNWMGRDSHHSYWLRLQIPSFYLYLKHWISQGGDRPVFYNSLTSSRPAAFNPLRPHPLLGQPSLNSPSNSGASSFCTLASFLSHSWFCLKVFYGHLLIPLSSV